jgi:hypothetical protein
VPALRRAAKKVRLHWQERGALATIRAIVETLVRPVFRYRKRLVYDIALTSPREPSEWGPGEKLLIFGPENIDQLGPELMATLEPEKHAAELQYVPRGDWLFIVVCEGQCIYRSYVKIADRQSLDRKSVFFGGLETLPEIRQALATKYLRGSLVRQVRKGLHTRVVNEQLRHLQSLGYQRATLYIMGGNILSIRGNTAAGFQLLRTLNDWIIFDTLVFQHVAEAGRTRWRVFFQ